MYIFSWLFYLFGWINFCHPSKHYNLQSLHSKMTPSPILMYVNHDQICPFPCLGCRCANDYTGLGCQISGCHSSANKRSHRIFLFNMLNVPYPVSVSRLAQDGGKVLHWPSCDLLRGHRRLAFQPPSTSLSQQHSSLLSTDKTLQYTYPNVCVIRDLMWITSRYILKEGRWALIHIY